MSASRLIQRLLRRRKGQAAVGATHIDIQPPATWGQAEPVWAALWGWLRNRPPPQVHPGPVLELARRDFCDALVGLAGDDATDLQRRAQHARSLRELWHLRAELYGIVARHKSQLEADRRLQLVNRHFPVRASVTSGPNTPSPHAKSHLP